MLEQTKKALRNELADLRKRRQGIEADERRVLALLGTPVKKIKTKAEPAAPAAKPKKATAKKLAQKPTEPAASPNEAIAQFGKEFRKGLKGTLKENIIAAVEKNPDGATVDEIMAFVKKAHPETTRGSVQMRVLELHKAGRLARSGKGTYVPAKTGK